MLAGSELSVTCVHTYNRLGDPERDIRSSRCEQSNAVVLLPPTDPLNDAKLLAALLVGSGGSENDLVESSKHPSGYPVVHVQDSAGAGQKHLPAARAKRDLAARHRTPNPLYVRNWKRTSTRLAMDPQQLF